MVFKKKFIQGMGVVSFFVFLLSLSTQAISEEIVTLTPKLLVQQTDKHNLIGFVPAEKNHSYLFETKGSAEEIIESLVEGSAEFGFLSPLDFFYARSRGLPLVALASPYQYPPIGFAYKHFVFRRSYDDFKGKRVLYEPNTLGELLFIHFLRTINLSPNDVSWIPLIPGNHKSFKDADIVILDKLSEIVHFSKNSETVRIIYPYEFGIEFKGPLLVTTESQLESNGNSLRGLAKGIFEQLQSNIFDPKNIYSVFLQRSIPYIYQTEHNLGELREKDFWQMERVLLEEGVLSEPVSYKAAYENVLGDVPPFNMSDVALPGLPSVDYAGFYIADEKGYFSRVQKDIGITHLSDETEVIDTVLKGDSMLGVASALNILKAYQEHSNLRVLGVIYQQDPSYIIALDGDLLKSKEQIKQISFLSQDSAYAGLLAALEGHDLTWADLNIREGYPTPLALLDQKVEVLSGRFPFEDMRWAPYRSQFHTLTSSRQNSIGLTIFTTQETYEAHRELIRNLLKAVFHGYENSLFQIEDSVLSILKKDGSLSPRDLRFLLMDNANYLRDSRGMIGSVNINKWKELVLTAYQKGFLEQFVDLSDLFTEDTWIVSTEDEVIQ